VGFRGVGSKAAKQACLLYAARGGVYLCVVPGGSPRPCRWGDRGCPARAATRQTQREDAGFAGSTVKD
jgi:hypothetical protein